MLRTIVVEGPNGGAMTAPVTVLWEKRGLFIHRRSGQTGDVFALTHAATGLQVCHGPRQNVWDVTRELLRKGIDWEEVDPVVSPQLKETVLAIIGFHLCSRETVRGLHTPVERVLWMRPGRARGHADAPEGEDPTSALYDEN